MSRTVGGISTGPVMLAVQLTEVVNAHFYRLGSVSRYSCDILSLGELYPFAALILYALPVIHCWLCLLNGLRRKLFSSYLMLGTFIVVTS